MSRRSLVLLPAVIAVLAAPVAPALAGEDDDSSATLSAPQGCVRGEHATAAVSGDGIDSVAYFLDGDHIKTVTRPNAEGRYSLRMNCEHLRMGAHRGRAVVRFAEGSTPARQTLRFQITRARQGSPRFAG